MAPWKPKKGFYRPLDPKKLQKNGNFRVWRKNMTNYALLLLFTALLD
jgi:hypothetical protein